MKELFDILSPRIFTVFSREDRNANYDLLSFIYDIFTKGKRRQSVPRDELVDGLAAHIQSCDFGSFEDDEGQDIAAKSAKDKASLKIRQFKKAGWLEENEDEDSAFSVVYSLNDNALTLLSTFRDIVTQDDQPLEYTGYFYAIYSILHDFSFNEAKGRLEQVKNNTTALFNSLQGLSSTIKRFIEEMVNKKDITPQEVLDTLLYKYQDQVVLTVFNNLKTKDNPSKYTTDIVKKLRDFRYNDDSLDKIVDNYASHTPGLDEEKYKELRQSICKMLDDCIIKFENVDSFVSLIDRRNMKFHSSALARLKFLINTRRDINGLLDSALKALKSTNPSSEYSDVIGIFSTMQIDSESTYSRSFDKEKVTFMPSEIPEVSEEEVELAKKKLFDDDEFSRSKVNEFAKKLLVDKPVVSSKEITRSNDNERFMFLMLELYSEYDDMCYTIHFDDDYYSKDGFWQREFEIMRKENKNEQSAR